MYIHNLRHALLLCILADDKLNQNLSPLSRHLLPDFQGRYELVMHIRDDTNIMSVDTGSGAAKTGGPHSELGSDRVLG